MREFVDHVTLWLNDVLRGVLAKTFVPRPTDVRGMEDKSLAQHKVSFTISSYNLFIHTNIWVFLRFLLGSVADHEEAIPYMLR